MGISHFAWLILYRIYQTGPHAQQLAGQIISLVSLINTSLESVPEDRHEQFLWQLARREGIRIVLAKSENLLLREPTAPFLGDINRYLRSQLGEDTPLRVQRATAHAVWISAKLAQENYWIIIPRHRFEKPFPWQWLGWAILGALLAIIGAYLIVSRINRPLERLALAATRIGKGETPEPLEINGPYEIRTVSRAFNQMSRDLQRLETDRTLMLAGVSHDLRTPLARLRLAIELLDETRDPVLKQGMIQDIEDMDNIITQFVDFARASSSETSEFTDLNRLVSEVTERFARLGKPIETDLPPLPSLPLKPLAMQRLLTNLLDNALRYGGSKVEVRTHRENATIILSVLDRGPGIPEPEAERLTQPFTRLDSSRSGSGGSGLGLAIVDRIAKLHNGSFRLLPRPDGGLEARLELPVS
jgi:two-component system osmolarity sensor histidine kinase EnvZ